MATCYRQPQYASIRRFRRRPMAGGLQPGSDGLTDGCSGVSSSQTGGRMSKFLVTLPPTTPDKVKSA